MSLSLVQDTIKNHFFTQDCLERVVAFADAGIQHEGWFNGEIVYLFDCMKKGGSIKSWSRECPSTIAGKCDFKLELVNATTVVFEMKALQQRDQRGLWRLEHSAVDIVDRQRHLVMSGDHGGLPLACGIRRQRSRSERVARTRRKSTTISGEQERHP